MKKITNKYHIKINLPDSSGTKGEQKIEHVLQEIGVSYQMQFAFDETGLRRKKFDAAVFHKDGTPAFLIEYDGEEHYDPGFYLSMGTRPERCRMHVERCHISDARKTKIALEHGMPLLRILPVQETDMRNLILSWVWTFLDQNDDINMEVSAVKMFDKYGWNFDYTAPSSPSKGEAEFLDERQNRFDERNLLT